ncbi:MAG: GNAT family N-acetyltransferase [Oscillospiraceae bacterium]|jgi:GNAT superfamily N-acetyltransferase|nr:GNAT family N-acetyltransferase [Oscillospiraceae bacterium]
MFEIRKAVSQDALGITIVNVYTWKTAYAGLMPDRLLDGRIARLREQTERCRLDIVKDDSFLVAVVGQTVVGFCRFGSSRNQAYRDSGEINAIYVLRGYQGTGIGRALFSAGARKLLSQGYSSMIVNCLQGNSALLFYRHLGGTVVAQREDKIEGGTIKEDIIYFNLTIH